MPAAVRSSICLLSSLLLSTNTKFAVYRTVVFSLVLYGCEIWSVILREELGLGVFENRVLTKIFRPKVREVAGAWRICIMRSRVTCSAHHILFG